METERLSDLPSLLLDWYRTNARDLPWRHTRDPYQIWVSEIMLQQTRVAAVLGYYERFLAAFPTVEALAAAPEEDLLSLWQGLGYYSRARNLHRAAKEAAESGGIPGTYTELRKLPGIGAYTAAAIASAAYGEPAAAVDGNVLRCMARILDDHAPSDTPAFQTRIRGLLEGLFPAKEEDIRIFNQSLMELGATVCVPNGEPKCGDCPVRALCLGCQRGTAIDLPVRREKKARRIEDRTVLVFLRGNRTALRKRPDRGLLAGLWEFPNLSGALDERDAAQIAASWGLRVTAWRSRMEAKHIFTHVEWHMTGYVVDAEGEGPFRWADREELETLAVPSAFVRFRTAASDALRNPAPDSSAEGMREASE